LKCMACSTQHQSPLLETVRGETCAPLTMFGSVVLLTSGLKKLCAPLGPSLAALPGLISCSPKFFPSTSLSSPSDAHWDGKRALLQGRGLQPGVTCAA
jgi:hypothetical protein